MCDKQHHGIDLVFLPQLVDELLQFRLADAEGPIGGEALGMRDRHVRKRLADDGNAEAADLLDRRRLEGAAGILVEGGLVVERGLFGEKHVLRQELAFEIFQVGAQPFFAIGELPVAGHRLDAEQICRLDHVGALHDVGQPAALPQIAAVDEQRAAGAGLGAQAVDQRLEMREAAEPAVAVRGLGKVEIGEGVRLAAFRRDAEMLEERFADQMRRLAGHGADAEIDARLAEMDRVKLRMRVGHVQQPHIAELADVVELVAIRGARQPVGHRRRTTPPP